MTTVFTIGYEGASIADLIATLQSVGVEAVLDVRQVAQSRRPGFSKTKLAAHLAEAGITYSHQRQLGDPKAGRIAAREGRYADFLAIFTAHLDLPETKVALVQTRGSVDEQPTALLCFERDPTGCHRTLVAKQLSELRSLSVRHLGVAADTAKGKSGAYAKAA